MLIEKDPSFKNRLLGKVVLITGAGGGIGLEAARAFIFMGAKVIIAEIDRQKITAAKDLLYRQFGEHSAEFVETDLSDTQQIEKLAGYLKSSYGCPDVVFNNAAIAPIGAVDEVPAEVWEKSLAVNFLAPLLLTRIFLPLMKKRNSGTIVFVSSSGAAAYMGAYEVFKTAQVELCNTLSGELENTSINVFTIGPGLVKTETAMGAIEIIASRMGMTIEDFYRMNESHILDAMEAGTGFALSVLMADRYRGQEIGSIQVLMDAGLLTLPEQETQIKKDYRQIIPFIQEVTKTYREQYSGWMKRNVFERQWVLRDFKKTTGYSADQFLEIMQRVEALIRDKKDQEIGSYFSEFDKLMSYYQHQHKLLQGFEKNPAKLQEFSRALLQYIHDLGVICDYLRK